VPLSKEVIWSVVLGISLSGFVSMIYEVAWSRTLSLLVDSSVYGFSIMLTTFLVGIALGSYFFSRKVDIIRFQGFVWAANRHRGFCLLESAFFSGTALLVSPPFSFSRKVHQLAFNR
jgi:hypothetical protein